MIVEKDYKLLEVREGLIKPSPYGNYYLNSVGEVKSGGFLERVCNYTKTKIKVNIKFKNKLYSFFLFPSEAVLTKDGWKSYEELSDTDFVMFFENLVMPYLATDLQMSPCKIDSIEFTSRTRMELVDLDVKECIINGVNIKKMS